MPTKALYLYWRGLELILSSKWLLGMVIFRQRGFTLLELLTAMAIASLVMLFALPAYRRWYIQSQVTASVHDLITALNYARSQAVSRGHYIHVCASQDQRQCYDRKDWQSGWLVYQQQPDQAKPAILQSYRGPGHDIQIRANGDKSLHFTANGFAMIGRSFHISHPESPYRHIVTVASTGRVAARRVRHNE